MVWDLTFFKNLPSDFLFTGKSIIPVKCTNIFPPRAQIVALELLLPTFWFLVKAITDIFY